jgi:hypothetical protein
MVPKIPSRIAFINNFYSFDISRGLSQTGMADQILLVAGRRAEYYWGPIWTCAGTMLGVSVSSGHSISGLVSVAEAGAVANCSFQKGRGST